MGRRPRREVTCGYCGETFREGRPSCPHCGSDSETGWRPVEEQDAAAVDTEVGALDDDAYADFLASEGLGRRAGTAPSREGSPLAAIVVILLLAAAAILLAVLR